MGNGLVFCSGRTETEAALEEFQASIEGKTLRDPFLVRFKTGRRHKAWVKNCVALGLSSGFVEPLESTAIHLIMIAATRLIQLFPFGPDWAAQRDRFNELSQYEIEQVRDFVILHYHLNRRDEEFWRDLREMEVPDTLRHRMESFVQGAHAWQATNEIFRVDSWVQVMLGQGLDPQAWHRMSELMSEGRLKHELEGLRQGIELAVKRMPSHQDFLGGYCPNRN